jgi:hypothetical protein
LSSHSPSKILATPLLLILGGFLLLAGCGSSHNAPTTSTGPVNNTAQVMAFFGPAGQSAGFVNGIYVTVTVCQRGTTTCVQISNVLVDTGSIGLRVLSSALSPVSLSQILQSNSPLLECIQYGDTSYSWGPMQLADVQIAGEKASNIPVQILGGTNLAAPSSCLTTPVNQSLPGSPPGNENTLQSLGANGILGIAGNNGSSDGEGIVDCGSICNSSLSGNPYYICPGSNCTEVLVPTSVQAANPVAAFSSDKNGVMFTFPSVPSTGASTLSGTMNFGIATQSDNALGNVTVYSMDLCGSLPTVTFNRVSYNDTSCNGTGSGLGGFFDTGSNALYVLDSNTVHSFNNSIADCTNSNETGFYCVTGGGTVTLTNISLLGNGVGSGTISLNIMDANALFNTNNSVFNDLGGDGFMSSPSTANDFFDFGSPFFFGRTVFIGIGGVTGVDSSTAPAGFVAF